MQWSPAAQAATDEGALRPELLIIGFAGAGDAYCRASLCGDRVGVVQLPSTDRVRRLPLHTLMCYFPADARVC